MYSSARQLVSSSARQLVSSSARQSSVVLHILDNLGACIRVPYFGGCFGGKKKQHSEAEGTGNNIPVPVV